MKYVLFGAGEYGKGAVTLFGAENIKFILDNSPQKWNTELNGIPVLNFYEAKDFLKDENVIITVASAQAGDIIQQLEEKIGRAHV